mmetsp:Transcript_95169/g.213149  ORF Transcript_95169/g.213149 Transcript_95169/m.213149 type:complete len:244 (-) Transcript_95169:27-758(-)
MQRISGLKTNARAKLKRHDCEYEKTSPHFIFAPESKKLMARASTPNFWQISRTRSFSSSRRLAGIPYVRFSSRVPKKKSGWTVTCNARRCEGTKTLGASASAFSARSTPASIFSTVDLPCPCCPEIAIIWPCNSSISPSKCIEAELAALGVLLPRTSSVPYLKLGCISLRGISSGFCFLVFIAPRETATRLALKVFSLWRLVGKLRRWVMRSRAGLEEVIDMRTWNKLLKAALTCRKIWMSIK